MPAQADRGDSARGATSDGSDPARALAGRRIIVGITGGIAAYKTAELVSRLVQAGADVTVAMTPAAGRFVAPLTFEALSGQAVYTSAWEPDSPGDPQHVALARSADAVVVAPCTMDCLARLATGLADDIVTLIVAAVDRHRTPVILAPAMNATMWSQPSTQRNVATLRGDGYVLVGPTTGWQACRTQGPGRMSEPGELLDAIADAIRVPAGQPTAQRAVAPPRD